MDICASTSESVPSQRFSSACSLAQSAQNLARLILDGGNAKFLHVDNKDSDQSARMCRLTGVFFGPIRRKVRFLTLRLIPFL